MTTIIARIVSSFSMAKRLFLSYYVFVSVLFFLGGCRNELEYPRNESTRFEYDDNSVFGVRWSINNPKDSGERCFDAINKSVAIGIGNAPGASDFDYIYPWSDIKRCNIISRGGSTQDEIVFEGEPGFSLDGSNGDVFVRIPVFCVERYEKDGYEYRTVSKSNGSIHPAFIEDGQILDAIYIAAFEGVYDEIDRKLYSKGGVIPSSTISGKEFLYSAQSRGKNYTLYDNRAVDAIFTLMAVEFGCRNTNHFLGYGYADFWQPVKSSMNMVIEASNNTSEVKIPYLSHDLRPYIPVGSNITICRESQNNVIAQRQITAIENNALRNYSVVSFSGNPIDVDETCFIGSAACTTNFCELCGGKASLSWHTGRADYIHNSNTQNPIRYRWLENLWGSLWHFLPDVSFNEGNMYICNNMDGYSLCQITAPYELAASNLPINLDNGLKMDRNGSNYWVTSLLGNGLGVSIAQSFDRSLTSKDAFGAYYYLSNSTVCIVNGGGFDHRWRCNILTNRAWEKESTSWYLYGARLMYKPIS